MTMIAFDGTTLVADGASTVHNKKMKPLFDEYHKTKIIIPNFNFHDETSGMTVKALAGTGGSLDIADVMEQILVIGRMNVDTHLHLVQLQHLLKDRTECQIVAICAKEGDGKTEVVATDLFRSGIYKNDNFEWDKYDAFKPAIAGMTENIPGWKLGQGWDSALEIVSFGSALFPDKVGGLLTRYNVLTGKLDHPKMSSKEILEGMYTKFRKEETIKHNERFSKIKDFINNPTNVY